MPNPPNKREWETGLLGEPCRQRVADNGGNQDFGAAEQRAEFLSGILSHRDLSF